MADRKKKSDSGWIKVPAGWVLVGWYTDKQGRKRPILERVDCK